MKCLACGHHQWEPSEISLTNCPVPQCPDKIISVAGATPVLDCSWHQAELKSEKFQQLTPELIACRKEIKLLPEQVLLQQVAKETNTWQKQVQQLATKLQLIKTKLTDWIKLLSKINL